MVAEAKVLSSDIVYHFVVLEVAAVGEYLFYGTLASGGLYSLILTIASLVIDKQRIFGNYIFKQGEFLS